MKQFLFVGFDHVTLDAASGYILGLVHRCLPAAAADLLNKELQAKFP